VLLARHFATQIGKELRGREAILSDTATVALRTLSWPGNVRELENAIERACILSDTMTLEPEDFGFVGAATESQTLSGLDLSGTLSDVTNRALRLVERRKIAAVLTAGDGHKARAADALGISYKTLLTKIKDYNL
jgi:DNA-binding NtrC family response regulator